MTGLWRDVSAQDLGTRNEEARTVLWPISGNNIFFVLMALRTKHAAGVFRSPHETQTDESLVNPLRPSRDDRSRHDRIGNVQQGPYQL
jgi:hypothetical protein